MKKIKPIYAEKCKPDDMNIDNIRIYFMQFSNLNNSFYIKMYTIYKTCLYLKYIESVKGRYTSQLSFSLIAMRIYNKK